MCVAVLVETREGPTSEELWQMEDANPHGAGIAWGSGDLIRYKKGLTWLQVSQMLPNLPRPCLVHFRWATHGGRARHLTHPFPIGPRALTSRKLNGAAKAVLIHNGVWSDYRAFVPEGIDSDKWSDTAVAAYAAGEFGDEILDHVDWATAVGRAGGNGRMDITLRGGWTEHNGNMYSNLSWQPVKRMYVGGGWGSWDDDEPYAAYGSRMTHLAADTGPRWRADGKLVDRGRVWDPETNLVTLEEPEFAGALMSPEDIELTDDKPISQWIKEFAEANAACANDQKADAIRPQLLLPEFTDE